MRSYLRGDRYRLDIGPRLARGYDGRRSWYLHYGLLLPPRDERYNAERWDFLTRFRGEGLVVEYVGPRKGNYRTLEAVRVIDTVFGRERLAYFDVGDSLLYAEVEAGRATTYRRYREIQGVLTPFEIGGGYRWHTELNTGLTADQFEIPEPVSWDPESVRIVVFEHAPVPPGGAAALRLQVAELAPGRRPPDDRLARLLWGRYPEGVPWRWGSRHAPDGQLHEEEAASGRCSGRHRSPGLATALGKWWGSGRSPRERRRRTH